MSIRSERSLENGISGLDLNGSATHAILTAPSQMANDHVNATISAAQNADSALGEANNLSTNHPEHPLKRTVVATIRASLGDLCLRKQKATWSPSPEALKSILQQKRFTSLSGTAEQSGDLKSIVLHNLALTSVSSDFKIRKNHHHKHHPFFLTTTALTTVTLNASTCSFQVQNLVNAHVTMQKS